MEYDAVVIGAGAAGLISAVRLSCSGKKILLLEKQPVPGGFGTAFRRAGFIFESSLHCVDGLGTKGEARGFLEALGLDKKIEFIELEDFCRVIYPEHDFLADFDCGHFAGFLKKNFPREEKSIDRLFSACNRFYRSFDKIYCSGVPAPLKAVLNPLGFLCIMKVAGLTAEQFISRYIKDGKLKGIFTDIWRFAGLPPRRLSALYFLLVFRGYYCQRSAYIKGGYSLLFRAMAEKIRETGSEIRLNSTVEKIVVEKNRVKSVITDKGEEFRAKTVISNASPFFTFSSLAGNDPLKKDYLANLARLEKSISAFQVYLGLKIPARELGMDRWMFSVNTTYDHEESFAYSLSGDYERCALSLVDHARIDPILVPAGKGGLLIMTLDAYSSWQNLTPDEYKKKKDRVAAGLIARAEKYLPGLSRNIETMEAATPSTIERYGMSPEGALYGFAQTVGQSGIMRLAQETPVKGLFLAGAWTRPGGGVHGCFVSGMDAAELVLKSLK